MNSQAVSSRGAIVSLFMLISAVVLAAGGTFVLSNLATKVYTAEAQLVVTGGLGIDDTGSVDVLTAPRIAQTYASLASTRPVLLEVIDRAGVPYDPLEVTRQLRISADAASPFIKIAVTDADPRRAAQVANALADILVEMGTKPATAENPEQVVLTSVERAVVPNKPSGPRAIFNTVMAAAAAFTLALTAIAGSAYLRGIRSLPQMRQG